MYFFRFFDDPGYKEYLESAASFNRKLNEERKMRLPYVRAHHTFSRILQLRICEFFQEILFVYFPTRYNFLIEIKLLEKMLI
jgi:hypothetical protein